MFNANKLGSQLFIDLTTVKLNKIIYWVDVKETVTSFT